MWKLVLVAGILGAFASRAHADLLRRAVDQVPGGSSPMSGSTGAPIPPPPAAPPEAALDDLQTWAGSPADSSLPALLETTMKQAPSLASAQFDIQIAEAQIEQTFGRNDWRLAGT